MRIQLPAETWIEILAWLNRHDLMKKLDALWDREFTPIVQDWLHKYTRNVVIGRLCTTKNASGFGLRNCKHLSTSPLPLPEVELPENVTGFEEISIMHFDSNVIGFLRRICNLFHNVHLCASAQSDKNSLQIVHIVLRHLLPLIGDRPIQSITLDEADGLLLLPLLSDANFQTAFFNTKLLNLLVYRQFPLETWQHLFNWLFTRHQDCQPRVLLLSCIVGVELDVFIFTVRLRFLDPARQSPSPFFIRFRTNGTFNTLVTKNVRTGEQLTVKAVINHFNKQQYVLITNCTLDTDNEQQIWLAKKMEEVNGRMLGNKQQIIYLMNSLEIGPLDEAEDAILIDNDEETIDFEETMKNIEEETI